MTINELTDYFAALPDEIFDVVPELIAETATEYYKESFTRKGFDNNPWVPAKRDKTTGSLMVESSNLVNSIRPAIVSREKVIISAGNDKVPYAQAHNEGYTGPVTIPAHTRVTKKGPVDVGSYVMNQNIPARPFLGESEELFTLLQNRIDAYLESIFNQD